ncbi:MAG TPA: DUF309 domain-containing protein [Planctomycetota bacterium]|nr:DUF309 domain-containing protein [Planctomycetota bacterium]
MLHGEPEISEYPERYKKGIWLFNNRHFFECHEILEEQWMDSAGIEKTFYQMIIHAAVAFVHWENGNRKGVLSLQHTFKLKAAAIPASIYMGLDIPRFKDDMCALIEPYRADMTLPLRPLAEIVTPTIHVTGFEPLPCDEHEMLILGRHIEEDE